MAAVQEVRVSRRERVPVEVARAILEPLAHQRHEGDGDRFVVPLGPAACRGEEPQRALEPLQRGEPGVFSGVPPCGTDVLGVVETARRLVARLEIAD